MTFRASAVLGGVCLLYLAACSDQTPQGPESADFGKIVPQCQLGCIDPDPEPALPGISLGSGTTGYLCFNGSQTDADVDGLSDFCEKNISAAFAPALKYTLSDNVGREPRWVAKPQIFGSVVRVAYLLSYYVDRGPVTGACNNNLLDLINREWCSGHDGDSELIVLDIRWDGAGHWVLDKAMYSAHGKYNTYSKTTLGYPPLEYVGNIRGGAPTSYVSYQKHANYKSEMDCDRDVIVTTDICTPQATARLTAGAANNLGSRSHQLVNCTTSANPIYSGSGRQECYWTDGQKFSGWHIGNPTATPYKTILTGIGF
jgi:hypothetical protein